MSKILEAMRKVASDPEGIFRLEAFDEVQLFPAPAERVGAEFAQLANSLVGRLDDGPGALGQVYVFASTMAGEGSSYVSYNVARILGQVLERRVAWVDGNFNTPQPKLEGRGIDLRSLLLEPALLSAETSRSGLTLIGNGTRRIKATELLASPQYLELLENFRRTFALTIIDAPPVLESLEVAHLAAPTQGLILVVQSRRLKHEVIRHGIEKLGSYDIPLIGTVLNKRIFDIPEVIYRRI